MLKQVKLMVGVAVVSAKQCHCVIAHTEIALIKNRLNLSPKKPSVFIYAVAVKPKPRRIVMPVIAN
jgi:hypothetical protein